jgi:hypothetical protein
MSLGLASLTEHGILFQTGVPVTFQFFRGTRPAPDMGSKYQQDIEPAGRYMIHNPTPGDLAPGYETGMVSFGSPLVIWLNDGDGERIYDRHSWKARLATHYGAAGADLSRAILDDGYDGVVTVSLYNGRPLDTREIVDLRPLRTNPDKFTRKLERSAASQGGKVAREKLIRNLERAGDHRRAQALRDVQALRDGKPVDLVLHRYPRREIYTGWSGAWQQPEARHVLSFEPIPGIPGAPAGVRGEPWVYQVNRTVTYTGRGRPTSPPWTRPWGGAVPAARFLEESLEPKLNSFGEEMWPIRRRAAERLQPIMDILDPSRRNPPLGADWLTPRVAARLRDLERCLINERTRFYGHQEGQLVCEDAWIRAQPVVEMESGQEAQAESGLVVRPGLGPAPHGPAGAPKGAYWHWWLRLGDGTIVDVASSQFGERSPLVIPAGHPLQRRYLPEKVDPVEGVLEETWDYSHWPKRKNPWDDWTQEDLDNERRRRLKRFRGLRRFVRFGRFGGASKIGLDPEFVATRGGGLYDPHLAEAGGSYGSAYERGISVYFAWPWGPDWIMESPDPHRAIYQLPYDYLGRALRGGFAEHLCAGDVFLIEGDLIIEEEEVYESTPWGVEHLGFTLPVFVTGSDGEPLIQNARILTKLDPWGNRPDLPKLFCCGSQGDYERQGRRRHAKVLMDRYRGQHKTQDDWCLRYGPEEVE